MKTVAYEKWSHMGVAILLYFINTKEITDELLSENMISSHVKIICYLHMWNDHCCCGYIIDRTFRSKNIKVKCLVFHWCLCNK